MEAAGWNMFITVSGFIFFFSNFIMVFNMIVSSVRGEDAPDDPWGGWSFEWMTSSPPPNHTLYKLNDGSWGLPTLEDANEHIANEPGWLSSWFQRLMVTDQETGETGEASH